METIIKDNISITSDKEWDVYNIFLLDKNTREIGNKTIRMVLGSFITLMEIDIKAIGLMTKDRAKVNFSILMGKFMREIF